MDEGFKKWLCEKAGFTKHYKKQFDGVDDRYYDVLGLWNVWWNMNWAEILIKSMWAVNREWYYEGSRGRYLIRSDSHSYHLDFGCSNGIKNIERFGYRNCENNDSEQKALTAALNYIYKETIGGKE